MQINPEGMLLKRVQVKILDLEWGVNILKILGSLLSEKIVLEMLLQGKMMWSLFCSGFWILPRDTRGFC